MHPKRTAEVVRSEDLELIMKDKLETLQNTSFFLNCCFDDQVRTRAEIVLASQRKPATSCKIKADSVKNLLP
jgi:hypothetical protein